MVWNILGGERAVPRAELRASESQSRPTRVASQLCARRGGRLEQSAVGQPLPGVGQQGHGALRGRRGDEQVGPLVFLPAAKPSRSISWFWPKIFKGGIGFSTVIDYRDHDIDFGCTAAVMLPKQTSRTFRKHA